MALGLKVGRPEKEINWKIVEELLEAGCSAAEIAPHFDIHYDTLYTQVEKKFGISFTQYSSKFKQKGESSIRKKQFDKALKGDNMMLIWLGKNRLKQSDQQHQDISINDPKIGDTIELAKLRTENAKLKEILNESKAGIEYLRGEQASEHLVRSSPVGENVQ